MYNSYSSYLGASKCCSIRTQGAEGAQGTQGKKGPIGPSGGPTGPTGTRGPQGIISFGTSSQGNMIIYNSSEPTKISETNAVQLDNLGNINVTGDVIPSVPGSATTGYNLGSVDNPWKKLYVASNSVEFVSSTGATGSIGLDDQSVFYSTNGMKSTFVNIGPSGTNPENFRGYSITSDAATEELLTQKIVGESPTGSQYLLNAWEKTSSGGISYSYTQLNTTKIESKYLINSSVTPTTYNPLISTSGDTGYLYYLFTEDGNFSINSIYTSPQLEINYIVIGGGGGGAGGGNYFYDTRTDKYNYGAGGGGGGAQVKTGVIEIDYGNELSIIVGQGGSGGVKGSPAQFGVNGQASSITGTFNVTSNGGFGGQCMAVGDNIGGVGGNSGSGYLGGSISTSQYSSGGGGSTANGTTGGSSAGVGGAGFTINFNDGTGTTYTAGKGGNGNIRLDTGGNGNNGVNYGDGAQGGAGAIYSTIYPSGLHGGNGGIGRQGCVLIYLKNELVDTGNISTGNISAGNISTGNISSIEVNTTFIQSSTIDITGNSSYKENTLNEFVKILSIPHPENRYLTSYFSSIAASSVLKTITVTCYNGSIFRSNDYGSTFTNLEVGQNMIADFYNAASNTFGTSSNFKTWTGVAMSFDQKYQTAVVNVPAGYRTYNVFRSSDYGLNWDGIEVSEDGTESCTSIAMSDNGQYQYIGVANSTHNFVFVSRDYGVSFTPYLGDGNGNRFPYVCCDSTGQYASAIYSAGGRRFVYTIDYGANWREYTFYQPNIPSYGTAIACSAGSAVGSPENIYLTALANTNNVAVIIGDPIDGTVSTTLPTSSFQNVYYNVVAMNRAGDIQVMANTQYGYIYYSTNNGYNWTPITNSITGWRTLKISEESTVGKIIFLAGGDNGLYSFNVKTLEQKYALTVKGNASIEGSCTSYGYYATSDYRIKENVTELDDVVINKIDLLRPVKYFNTNSLKNEYGFIAHEVQELIPELVEGEKDAEQMQCVNYTAIVPILVKKLQENDVTIKALEERISKLEKKD